MKEGDYVKLGRVRFRIREVRCHAADKTTQIPELQKFVSEKFLVPVNINTDDEDAKSQADEPTCKICYNDSLTNDENPLVDCCNC